MLTKRHPPVLLFKRQNILSDEWTNCRKRSHFVIDNEAFELKRSFGMTIAKQSVKAEASEPRQRQEINV